MKNENRLSVSSGKNLRYRTIGLYWWGFLFHIRIYCAKRKIRKRYNFHSSCYDKYCLWTWCGYTSIRNVSQNTPIGAVNLCSWNTSTIPKMYIYERTINVRIENAGCSYYDKTGLLLITTGHNAVKRIKLRKHSSIQLIFLSSCVCVCVLLLWASTLGRLLLLAAMALAFHVRYLCGYFIPKLEISLLWQPTHLITFLTHFIVHQTKWDFPFPGNGCDDMEPDHRCHPNKTIETIFIMTCEIGSGFIRVAIRTL